MLDEPANDVDEVRVERVGANEPPCESEEMTSGSLEEIEVRSIAYVNADPFEGDEAG
jgi:hypothetical protein